MEFNTGDVWMAEFPFEDTNETKMRPVIVLDSEEMKVLAVKVTSKEAKDDYDVTLLYWKNANLRLKSVARTSKTILLPKENFKWFMGTLYEDDLNKIISVYINYLSDNNLIK